MPHTVGALHLQTLIESVYIQVQRLCSYSELNKPLKYGQQVHMSVDHKSTTAKVGSENDNYLDGNCLSYPPPHTQNQFYQSLPSF